MEENKNGKGCGGFTLVETLLVTAILVILLGLALVGVARYQDYLKITELDNEAREIFMAAENRAVLLENSGESVSLLGEKQEGIAAPIELSNQESSDGANLNTLLPAGVIDPALRDGHFIILYDASTHHVKEVFYAEGDIDPDLDLFRQSRFERVSYYRGDTSSRRLVGWYSGGEAENIGTKPLPTPGVEVLIENGEELTLTVRYTMPEGLPTNAASAPSVKLECGGTEVDLLASARTPEINGAFGSTAGTTVTYKWVLDSLVKNSSGNSQQFRDLVSAGLGGSFTVTAGLKLKVGGDGYIDSAYYAQGTDNSLFAKKTDDGDTAYIANVRHLQNLCMDFSGVGAGITKAEQLTDIECGEYKNNQGEVLDPNYNFIPIANGALTSYDGKTKAIRGLYVSCSGDAGLFGLVTNDITVERIRLLSPWIASSAAASIGGESNAAPLLARVDEGTCTLKNIEVIDGSAEGRTYVGGLVGVINHKTSCRLENCRVYWTEPKELVKSSGINYKISGKYAGGLIGYASGTASIEGSFAAATVKGDTGCGGLVGRTDTSSLTVSKSYADCYLTGNKEAGGLVGPSKAAPKLTGCYAAGFIMDPGDSLKTAGLVNGTVSTAQNCYSVVRVLKDSKLGRPATLLFNNLDAGSGNVRYLYTAAEVTANQFGPAFEYETAKPETHVYDLRHRLNPMANPTLKLTPPYPFPGLKGLPHYGDWAELNVDPVPAGLAYYETYKEGDTRLSGAYEPKEGQANMEFLKEDTQNPVVTKDGYALMFKGDTVPSSACMVTYGAQEWTLDGLTWVLAVGEGETPVRESVTSLAADGYILIPLPDTIVTGKLAEPGTFFQKLEYQGKLDGTDTEKEESARTFYFNPHFAKTVTAGTVRVETTGGAEKVIYTKPQKPAEPTKNPAYVRTARHLYDLSVYQSSYAVKSFCFKQELDIDYAGYKGYPGVFAPAGEAMPFEQDPIGEDSSIPFVGTYDGGFHVIQNVFFPEDSSSEDRGLFGVFGKNGESKLENVVYKLDPAKTLRTWKGISVGALVSTNCGTIKNCAVYGVNMNVSSNNVGGLVGVNQGKVINCAAELANLSVGSGTSGGLVGSQSSGGSVENSYAVGRLENDTGGGIAGLVGKGGEIKTSYAAVDLVSTKNRYGLCGDNVVVDEYSGWLKDVFVYRGIKYNITATTDYIDSKRAVVFTKLQDQLKSAQAKATYTIRNIPADASYGPSCAGKAFPYITGVTTALSRDPDTGIITGKLSTDLEGQKVASVHYGLWPMPLPVGLAYYETYAEGDTHLSGAYENEKPMSLKEASQNPVVKKDGYGLIFAGDKDDIPAGDYKIKYSTVTASAAATQQNWTLTKSAAEGAVTYEWKQDGTAVEQEVKAIAADGYTLVPLPDKIVTGEVPKGDIKPNPFNLSVEGTRYDQELVYGEGLYSARTFYFNPHFAGKLKDGKLESVKAGSVAADSFYTKPTEPNVEEIENRSMGNLQVWAATCEDVEKEWEKKTSAISVRTPRHLYALSRFQNTYVVDRTKNDPDDKKEPDPVGRKYYFKQALDLDYNTYDWYGEEMPKSNGQYYEQVPIGQGTQDDGFKGAYNGGGHTIRNVFYTMKSAQAAESKYNISPKSQYVGLFRYVEYIWNVNYEAPSGIVVKPENQVENPNNAGSDLVYGVKVGSLIGGCFRSSNCTVVLKDFTVECDKGTHIYIGGLAGYSNKMNGCKVVVEGCLKYSGRVPTVYVGGLQGLVYQEVVNSTSKVQSLVVTGWPGGSQTVYAGGLLGGITLDSLGYMTRVVAGCATEIKDLRVENGGTSYVGGLIGYNKSGGNIYASYAVGAIGKGDTNQNHHYSGLVGLNENGDVRNYLNVVVGRVYTTIQNCYSAVGLPADSGNRNYNFCPNNPAGGTILDCYYLTGTWTYGGYQYTALSNESPVGITGKSYDDLKKPLPSPKDNYYQTLFLTPTRKTIYVIPTMSAGGTEYPFPVHTGKMQVQYGTVPSGAEAPFTVICTYEKDFLPYPGDKNWPKPVN